MKHVVELHRLVRHPDLESDRAMLAQVEEELANDDRELSDVCFNLYKLFE